MEYEIKDPYKASTITLKFAAYKTPLMLGSDVHVPAKMFFTFKFFTFKAVSTEKVILKLPSELEEEKKGGDVQEPTEKVRFGT